MIWLSFFAQFSVPLHTSIYIPGTFVVKCGYYSLSKTSVATSIQQRFIQHCLSINQEHHQREQQQNPEPSSSRGGK